MENLLPIFAEFGVPGLVIGYLFWSNGKKEERISELTDRLVDRNSADADRFTQQTLLMERILMAVNGGQK